MKYKVTVEVREVLYRREYDSDAGPKEILERIRDAVEARTGHPKSGHGSSGHGLRPEVGGSHAQG